MNPGCPRANRLGAWRAIWAAGLTAGCLLGPEAASSHAQITTTVQFDREIVRILDNHCVLCHHDTGPAFPLLTYEQTYTARWKIRQDALDRRMAPWAAVPGYGEFSNSNALTQREIDFLVSWAESFGPRNNGEVYTGVADTPAAPKVVQAHFDPDRWALGPPDARVTVGSDSTAGGTARGPVAETRRTTVDLKLRSQRWLKALEYHPADLRGVHAASFSIQETGQWIGTWTPWHGFMALPQGLAYRLPAGSHLVSDTLYYGSGAPRIPGGSGAPTRIPSGSSAPADGGGTLGLYFDRQPSHRAVTNLVLNPKAAPGAPQKLLAAMTLEADTEILAIQPDVRPGLQSVEVSALTPRGSEQVLLFAKAIPIDWPTPYIYASPVLIQKGAQLSVIEHYASGASVSTGSNVVFSVHTE